jgi:hypothetical protein
MAENQGTVLYSTLGFGRSPYPMMVCCLDGSWFISILPIDGHRWWLNPSRPGLVRVRQSRQPWLLNQSCRTPGAVVVWLVLDTQRPSSF